MNQTIIKITLLLGTLLLIIFNLTTQPVELNHLVKTPPMHLMQIEALETKYLYFLTHIVCFLPVFALSFDRRVHYFKEWRFLWKGLLATAAFFIVWDFFKTNLQVWGFNPSYYLGITIAGLPLEECFFFLTFPFCSIFIYECLNFYVKKDFLAPFATIFTYCIIFVCIILSIFYWEKAYTSTTCMAVGAGFLYHHLFIKVAYRGRMYLAMLVVLLAHFIADSVFTGAFTREALVIYNPDEYMRVFIGSIPIEDFIYGFLLMLMNVSFLEYYRQKNKTTK